MSLYRQLWIAALVSMALALVGALFASLWSAHGYIGEQLSLKNADNANALALSLSQSHADATTVELAVASLFDTGHYAWIQVKDPQGRVIAERRDDAQHLGVPEWFAKLLPLQGIPGQAQISDGWQQVGTVTLLSHSRFAYEGLWSGALQMAALLAAIGVVSGWLASLVVARLRAPLQAVIAQAHAITERRFVTIAMPAVPELRQLAQAMNATVQRLKTMFEEEAARLEDVRREANHDTTTGLANRAFFIARLRQTLSGDEAGGGYLLLIRLLHLSAFNQKLGRDVVDSFLLQVGQYLQQSHVHDAALCVARLNGSDLAVLLPNSPDAHEQAGRVLQEIMRIGASFFVDERVVCAAVGGVVVGEQPGAVMARLDTALAQAQSRVSVLSPAVVEVPVDAVPTPAIGSQEWGRLLQQALQERRMRLAAYPVLATDRLLHWECPVRMQVQPGGEWLVAGQFLPMVERLQLCASLDLLALELGLQTLAANPQAPGIAINMSAHSLAQPRFAEQVCALLAQHTAHTGRLWLEWAEAGLLHYQESFARLCTSLQAHGCHVGIEHFGHALDKIGFLHPLGLQYVKVDSSFVSGIDHNTGNQTYLKGLVSMIHGIGLLVMAEGVSTRAEQDVLLQMGFDGVTGPSVEASEQRPLVFSGFRAP